MPEWSGRPLCYPAFCATNGLITAVRHLSTETVGLLSAPCYPTTLMPSLTVSDLARVVTATWTVHCYIRLPILYVQSVSVFVY